MSSVTDVCFMCTNNYDCSFVDDGIVTQVEYLMPEITVLKLGVPLRICCTCEKKLQSFNEFKQSCVANSQHLEAKIKESQHTCSRKTESTIVATNSNYVEDITIKEEPCEEIPYEREYYKIAIPGTSDQFEEIYIKNEEIGESSMDYEDCIDASVKKTKEDPIVDKNSSIDNQAAVSKSGTSNAQRHLGFFNSVPDKKVSVFPLEEDSESSIDDKDVYIHSDDNISVSEQSIFSDEESVFHGGAFMIGRDKTTRWEKQPLIKSRIGKQNIPTRTPGPINEAKNATGIKQSWNLFFSDNILIKIVECTNIKIRQTQENYARGRDAKETDLLEIQALFGLMYLSGLQHSSHQNILDLWKQDGTGIEIYRLIMGVSRFQFLLRMLRFDDVADVTRKERKQLDKLTYIRYIVDDFSAKCRENYSPGAYVTVDGMMSGFRGRCSFRVYMHNKQDKYGIKIWTCTDAESFYCSNLEVFVGKQNDGPYLLDNQPSEILKRLVSHLEGSGRNITTDNYFTSVPLSMDLNSMGLTIVGTLRRNTKELPSLFTSYIKARPVKSSIFGFSKDCTIVSYKPKHNKYVSLLSTMHFDDNIDKNTDDDYKPDIFSFYNKTKGGVDASDRLRKSFTVSRVSNRWPMTIFYTLMDIGAINSYIIYKANTKKAITRREYLRQLGMELLADFVKRKVEQYIPNSTKSRLKEIFEITTVEADRAVSSEGRCAYCPKRKNRKSRTKCMHCKQHLCREHSVVYCDNCLERLI